MVENVPPEAMSSMSPEMMQNMPPEAQNAVSEASDGGLGALDEALKSPPTDGEPLSMGSSADALDYVSAGQVQGGAGVSSDDATTTGAEAVETDDDKGSSEDDSSLIKIHRLHVKNPF